MTDGKWDSYSNDQCQTSVVKSQNSGNQNFSCSDFKLDETALNPYAEGKCLSTIATIVPRSTFQVADFSLEHTNHSPYVTPLVYQQQKGVAMNFLGSYSSDDEIFEMKTDNNLDILENLGEYFVTSDGLYLKPKKLSNAPIRICNFFHKIIGFRRVHHKNGNITNEIIYEVMNHEGEPQTIAAESYKEITGYILKKYPDCFFVGDSNLSGKARYNEASAILYANAKDNVSTRDLYCYHGWEKINGRMVYLSSSREDCDCNCTIPNIPQNYVPDIFRNGINILNIGKKIYLPNGSLDVIQTFKVSVPFFLYLHLGFMAKLYQDAGLDVQFLLILVGQSGSLKTSICKAFAEPFNTGKMLRFESTPRALELYCEESLDMTMIADDIFSKNNVTISKFEGLLRPLGDSIGRAKSCGKNFGEISRTTVRGGCIVTAENFLGAQQSSVLRSLTLNLNRNSIDTEVLRAFQDNQQYARQTKNYSKVQLYFAAFIQYLEQNYEKIVTYLSQLNFSDFPEAVSLSRRYQKTYLVLEGIAQTILTWGMEVGVIDSKNFEEFRQIWKNVVLSVLTENEMMAKVSDPCQQFLLTLHKNIAVGNILIASDKSEYECSGGKFFGYLQSTALGGEYVLDSDKTFLFVKKQLQELGSNFVAEPKNIFKDLYEQKIVLGYSNKDGKGGIRQRYLKKVKLNGHSVEMLVLSKDGLEEGIKKIEEENSNGK